MDLDVASLDCGERPEASARDGSRTLLACGIGLSAILHVGVILIFLLGGTFALGMSGAPGPLNGALMVGLYDAPPGDPEGGDGEVAGAGPEAEPETRDPVDEPMEAPLDEPPDFEPTLAEPPELQRLETPPPEPDLEAVALERTPPEPEKKEKPKERPRRTAKKTPVKAETPAKENPAPKAGFGRPGAEGSGKALSGSGSGQGQGSNVAKPGGGGGGGGGGGSLKGYIDANYKYITRLIRRKMVYPDEAKKQGLTGTATVAFTISGSGQASNIRISRSSGSQLLDQAALSAVHRASPFPPPPAPANITIPLVFGLR